ncbi:succinyldiaminopimelate transaminase [Thiospirillum jenense]|uniref:Succinyldiaminopimelate transaminase n=1 Tax=Thiospirillum jenense TaxID=1653858 RepID=A0A839HCV6_9GAMM|nr:succinyldiaminopimelate transaminase [Thiospirillum jenense]MBB1125098.1 succinyldiaminopimelate transaminase [Thiospirillum jenense]
MNQYLKQLQPYPFAKLAALQQGVTPPPNLTPIVLSIGEPTQPTPAVVTETLCANLQHLSTYPNTRGLLALREAIAAWLCWRFALPTSVLNPNQHILPVNGTREALFAIAQTIINPQHSHRPPRVIMPNPFYQIYEGAALLAGAQPYYLNCTAQSGFIPDFAAVPEEVWRDCQLLYLCSPGNPTGAVFSLDQLKMLITLAQQYDFVIAADECYSELYPHEDQPPSGLLQAAMALGLDDFRRCLVFHSLSKRSNAPGLRSGFVAGDAQLIAQFFNYRTYHGCAMPLHHQYASMAAWRDETHVIANRAEYRAKFTAVLSELNGVLNCAQPDGGFYLWVATPMNDTIFARELFATQHVTVLPGQFLSRPNEASINPGNGYVRIALVAPLADCIEAAKRLRQYLAAL